jgi:hypothetical protein
MGEGSLLCTVEVLMRGISINEVIPAGRASLIGEYFRCTGAALVVEIVEREPFPTSW